MAQYLKMSVLCLFMGNAGNFCSLVLLAFKYSSNCIVPCLLSWTFLFLSFVLNNDYSEVSICGLRVGIVRLQSCM